MRQHFRGNLIQHLQVLREILERSGIVSWVTARMKDPRSKVDVTHDLASLIRTVLESTAKCGAMLPL